MTWDADDVAAMRLALDRCYIATREVTVPPYWARRCARSRWDGEREHPPRRRFRILYKRRRHPGNTSSWCCGLAGRGCPYCDAAPLALDPL